MKTVNYFVFGQNHNRIIYIVLFTQYIHYRDRTL